MNVAHLETYVDISGKDRGERRLWFMCPGCHVEHAPVVRRPSGSQVGPCWTWNESLERPTLAPSIRVSSGLDGKFVCHSFVTDGQIQFLADCTHGLAGQTVALSEWVE